MLVKSTLLSSMSGKLAGLVAARTRFGTTLRALTVPINPDTVFQQVIRNAMASAQQRWRAVLTPAERSLWDVYAANTGWENRFGDVVYLTGFQEYARQAIPRSQAEASAIDPGPTEFTRPAKALDTFFTVDATTDEVEVTLSASELWLAEDDAHMLVYCSRPQNPTRLFWAGPYRFAGTLDGDSVTPISGTVALPLPFPAVPDQLIHGYALISRADGRISRHINFQAVATV